jgi:hypothetical protein
MQNFSNALAQKNTSSQFSVQKVTITALREPGSIGYYSAGQSRDAELRDAVLAAATSLVLTTPDKGTLPRHELFRGFLLKGILLRSSAGAVRGSGENKRETKLFFHHALGYMSNNNHPSRRSAAL